MPDQFAARRLEVNGIVQGVGFRPFVYQLARRHHLNGEVSNTSAGVLIHVEGTVEAIAAFAEDLVDRQPPLAHITEIVQHEAAPNGYKTFSIAASHGAAAMSTLISPDVSVCEDCRKELFDPGNRRYRYPFINCTNCGPRYTIIDDIPYDRPKTSMRHFQMCPRCQAEYDDPLDRRFHAQPNACAICGPHVTLCDAVGACVQSADPIVDAVKLLKQGCILAVKGLGGFHLAVDAENDAAVRALRQRKRREEKPLALMAGSLAAVRRFAAVSEAEERLLTSRQRPIVLLQKKDTDAISASVSPGNRYFGVMLPYTPLHYLLLENDFTALVMTSGNLSEEPIAIDNQDAFRRLAGIAEYFLVHDRDIFLRSDDSIIRHTGGADRLIRRSRGYVPTPVFLRRKVPPVLACGAELKNTVCMTRADQAFLSQHIGDLENPSTHAFFELTVRHMLRILQITPEIIAHDLHPDYLNTRWALEQPSIPKTAVQHHHAHVVSAMAENRLDGQVIGLSCDGTGYGTDGAIWGGEVLLADERTFERAAHIDYVPMPGSSAAIRQPWRMGLSYLQQAFGEEVSSLPLPFLTAMDRTRLKTVLHMAAKRINAPLTSSLGRLFDGVAAIVGLRDAVAFEGQAAMELEMIAAPFDGATYPVQWTTASPIRIPPDAIIRGVVDDVVRGVSPGRISGRFHATLVRVFAELCAFLRRETGLERVVLSGGVFQNAILLQGLCRALAERRFEVYTHKLVPTNDGGISLGQAVIAAAQVSSPA